MSLDQVFIKSLQNLLKERKDYNKELVLGGSLESIEDYTKFVGIVKEIELLEDKIKDLLESFNTL